jgi:hypothetical protein
VGIAIWIILNPSVFSPRYILATLLLLLLFPARCAEYISLNDQRPRLLAMGVLACTIISLSAVGLSLLDWVFFPADTLKYLMESRNECKYDGVYCEAMKRINRDAEAGDRVYLASYQHYWLRGDLLQCTTNQNDPVLSDATGEQLWLQLYQNGFKYVFIDEATHSYIVNQLALDDLPEWVSLETKYNESPLSVYKIIFNNPPSTVQPARCQRLPSSTIWEVVFP